MKQDKHLFAALAATAICIAGFLLSGCQSNFVKNLPDVLEGVLQRGTAYVVEHHEDLVPHFERASQTLGAIDDGQIESEEFVNVLKGLPVREQDLITIGEGRFREKSIAIRKEHIPKIATRVRRIASEEGIDLSAFTDEKAEKAWQKGRLAWDRIRLMADVLEQPFSG